MIHSHLVNFYVKNITKTNEWKRKQQQGSFFRSSTNEWRKNHRTSVAKPVLQLDKQTGEVIRKWECAADVERELGFNHGSISACCHGKLKSAGGFKWQFAS